MLVQPQPTRPLLATCCLLSLLALPALVACGDKGPDPRKATLCEKLQERNRKCVDTLVKTVHQRMGNKVPADVKKRLAKPLAAEISKRNFVNLCKENSRAKDARAKANRAALQKCLATADCAAYAPCMLDTLRRLRGKPKPAGPPSKP